MIDDWKATGLSVGPFLFLQIPETNICLNCCRRSISVVSLGQLINQIKNKVMTYTICLHKQRAQLVVKGLNNGTRIVSEPDSDGWVKLEVVISHSCDILHLYHAGMSAERQRDLEFRAEVGY